MDYDPWVARAFRETLEHWDGPEPLHDSRAVAFLASVIRGEESTATNEEKVRQSIEQCDWPTLLSFFDWNKDRDMTTWYLVVLAGGHQYIVERDSLVEAMAEQFISRIWRITRADLSELEETGIKFVPLQVDVE